VKDETMGIDVKDLSMAVSAPSKASAVRVFKSGLVVEEEAFYERLTSLLQALYCAYHAAIDQQAL
jgi:hypothetical protein